MATQNVIDKNKLATFKQQMKHDIELLKLDADFWEYKFKASHYKMQHMQLEADMENFRAAMQKQQAEILASQGELNGTPEAIQEAIENMQNMQKVEVEVDQA